MDKPIDRFYLSDNGLELSDIGAFIRYQDHQELLQGLLKSILSKEYMQYGRQLVYSDDIIEAFKKLGVKNEN